MDLNKEADTLVGILGNAYSPPDALDRLASMRRRVQDAARQITGAVDGDLEDENEPMHSYYYATEANLWTKLLLAAAQKQTYYREVKG